jgi:hypothetical protein
MKRILFLVLWIIPVLISTANGAVEIYVNGHKYDSLQAYQLSKKSAQLSAPMPASLNVQQQDYIRQEAQQLGINVDFSKIKTFEVKQKNLSDSTLHKLYVLGVEHGVATALQDFYQGGTQDDIPMSRSISPKQLQEAIQEAVAGSKDLKLLISKPGKLRIMTVSPDSSGQ